MFCRHAYARFNELYCEAHIKKAACWTNARHKIHDVHVRAYSILINIVLMRFDQLYAVEAGKREMPTEGALPCDRRKRSQDFQSWQRRSPTSLARTIAMTFITSWDMYMKIYLTKAYIKLITMVIIFMDFKFSYFWNSFYF